MKPAALGALATALLLAGCGGMSRHCQGEFAYQQAVTLPPPAPVENLTVPESPGAMRIPPAPQQHVPFGSEVPDPENPEDMRLVCLDVPPPLLTTPEPEPPAAVPEKPVPALPSETAPAPAPAAAAPEAPAPAPASDAPAPPTAEAEPV